MSIQILRDLRGLRVQVIHAPDTEGVDLVDHLRRVGCQVEPVWPIPEAAESADVVVLAIDHESRAPIQRLLRSFNGAPPTLIAVVGYEDPSILVDGRWTSISLSRVQVQAQVIAVDISGRQGKGNIEHRPVVVSGVGRRPDMGETFVRLRIPNTYIGSLRQCALGLCCQPNQEDVSPDKARRHLNWG